MLQKLLLEPLFFLKQFGCKKKETKYIRHFMTNFQLFRAETSAYYYSSMKDKWQTSCVITYCLSKKFKFTDMKQQEVEYIEDMQCQITTGKILILIKNITRDIADLRKLVIFQMIWYSKQRRKVLYHTLNLRFHTIYGCCF